VKKKSLFSMAMEGAGHTSDEMYLYQKEVKTGLPKVTSYYCKYCNTHWYSYPESGRCHDCGAPLGRGENKG
jgi:rubrerythrin